MRCLLADESAASRASRPRPRAGRRAAPAGRRPRALGDVGDARSGRCGPRRGRALTTRSLATPREQRGERHAHDGDRDRGEPQRAGSTRRRGRGGRRRSGPAVQHGRRRSRLTRAIVGRYGPEPVSVELLRCGMASELADGAVRSRQAARASVPSRVCRASPWPATGVADDRLSRPASRSHSRCRQRGSRREVVDADRPHRGHQPRQPRATAGCGHQTIGHGCVPAGEPVRDLCATWVAIAV